MLNRLYARCNDRQFVHPDPLEFLYRYPELADREIAGLVASSLAYGRVAQILQSVAAVLARMPQPRRYVCDAARKEIHLDFRQFRHRFTSGAEMAALLCSMGRLLRERGSIEEAFADSCDDADVRPALSRFIDALGDRDAFPSLIPDPRRGSALKRLNLYLRWMVRTDNVDPGGWTAIQPHQLIVPLDTHLHRTALTLGLTSRPGADMWTAVEITRSLSACCPQDPVRYDFALTRPGIWKTAGG